MSDTLKLFLRDALFRRQPLKVTVVNTRSNDFKSPLVWSVVNGVWEEKDLRVRFSSSFSINRRSWSWGDSCKAGEKEDRPSSHNLRDKFTISRDTFHRLLNFPFSDALRLGHFRHKLEELGRWLLFSLLLLLLHRRQRKLFNATVVGSFVVMLSLMWICLTKRNSAMTQSEAEEEDGWAGWRLKGYETDKQLREYGWQGGSVRLARDCTWWSFSSVSSLSR